MRAGMISSFVPSPYTLSPDHSGEFNCSKDLLGKLVFFVDELAKTKLDRMHFSVAKLNDSDEKAYWLSKSPAERLEAVELMRQMIYGYDPIRDRLRRILTVVRLGEE